MSTNSQRSSSMNHPIAGYRNSYSSVHRPSCGSVMPSKPHFPEIVPKESDEANDEVITYSIFGIAKMSAPVGHLIFDDFLFSIVEPELACYQV